MPSIKRLQRWVLLPDLHTPFHNTVCIDKICKFIHRTRPYGIVLMGDFLDLFSLAKWNENSLSRLKNINLTYEYEKGRRVLSQIDSSLPRGISKHYLYGNHEDRYIRTVERGDTAKYGKELTSPEDALHLRERGYRVYTDWRSDSVKLGRHLEVVHGMYTPVNAAKKHLDEYQGSVVFGHTHRWGAAVDGKRGSFNIGFLGDKNSAGFIYEPRHKRDRWVNGFGVANIAPNGDYWMEGIQIWNNTFVVDGHVY